MGTDCNICSNKCLGFDNNHGGCCTVADRNFIIGPHSDPERFISDLSDKFGRKINYDDVFINHQEGSKLFPDKATWQQPQNYPALRVDTNNSIRPCIFYNMNLRACMVYEMRPTTCQLFECQYLIDNTQQKS